MCVANQRSNGSSMPSMKCGADRKSGFGSILPAAGTVNAVTVTGALAQHTKSSGT